MDPLRVAWIGVGWWGNVLAAAAVRAGTLKIMGGTARSADKRAAFAQKYKARDYDTVAPRSASTAPARSGPGWCRRARSAIRKGSP